MMISTKGRYALRVLVDMAEHPSDGYIPLKDIARRQEISEKYLESIVRTLVQAQILEGLRGKGGGYRLKKPRSNIPRRRSCGSRRGRWPRWPVWSRVRRPVPGRPAAGRPPGGRRRPCWTANTLRERREEQNHLGLLMVE